MLWMGKSIPFDDIERKRLKTFTLLEPQGLIILKNNQSPEFKS